MFVSTASRRNTPWRRRFTVPPPCRSHGKKCPRRLASDGEASDGEASDEAIRSSVRCLESLRLPSLGVCELMDRALSIDPWLSTFNLVGQLIQITSMQPHIVGASLAGHEKFRTPLAVTDEEIAAEQLRDKIQARLLLDFAVLGVFQGTHKLGGSDMIRTDNMKIVAINVASKEHLMQLLQYALKRQMSHDLSRRVPEESQSEGEPDICGFLCCPQCYDDHKCAQIEPFEF